MTIAVEGTSGAPKTKFRWVVAGLIFIIYAIASADRANIGFAMPFIRKEFAMSNAEAGAVLSLFLWGYALMQIPSGFAVSRFGVRRLFSAAMILTSLFTGLVGVAGSVLTLKLCRFALGLAEGPLPIGITTTINTWFPPREKGTASGLFLSAVKFGPVIVPPVCAVIVSIWGWREIFFFCALPGFVFAALWYVLVPDRPSDSRHCSAGEIAHIADKTAAADPATGEQRAPRSFPVLDRLIGARRVTPLETTRDVFKDWNVWGCALGYSFQIGISNVLLAWIPTYLLTVKQFSVMGTGFVAAAPWVGAVAGNILGGFVSDRVFNGRRKPGMLFSALATSGTMVALINSPADPTAYGLLLFATGLLLSIGFSAYMAYPMALATKPAFPVTSALVNTGGQIGGASAPLLVGLLLDSYGWDSVFLFMGLGSLVSFALVATIVEPSPDRQATA
ncbi:MFS transporter [Azospirillum cavernae]|uniref:MFS transporter n=1 Tax=Azospirillum cavernae TaxID=2320860 RepID=A0A418VQ18_9PROT|nr:MFS transporter [Azospirillum cavernae]RJF78363.1 MFS transporter [Azospirillum cavernae]